MDDGRFALRHREGDRLESSDTMGEFELFLVLPSKVQIAVAEALP